MTSDGGGLSKRVRRPRLRNKMPTYAGLDWGGAHHQLAVVDDDGRELFNTRHRHDREGLANICSALTGLSDLVGVAIERSDGIVVDELQAHAMAVFPVSPRVSARARERQPDLQVLVVTGHAEILESIAPPWWQEHSHLEKPFEVEALRQRVAALIGEAHSVQ